MNKDKKKNILLGKYPNRVHNGVTQVYSNNNWTDVMDIVLDVAMWTALTSDTDYYDDTSGNSHDSYSSYDTGSSDCGGSCDCGGSD